MKYEKCLVCKELPGACGGNLSNSEKAQYEEKILQLALAILVIFAALVIDLLIPGIGFLWVNH